MKKIIYIALLLSPVAIGQSTDYTLNQAVNVGCSSGIADLGKKITVEKTAVSAKFSLTNLACSKSYDGSLKVDFGSGAIGFFDSKEKKGIIIDEQVISLFNNDGNSYQVVVAGHEDKKQAKTISTEAQQAKYKAGFDGFDAMLEKAKKDADIAKTAALTIAVPLGNFSDPDEISGLYYFSETVKLESYGNDPTRYVNAVQLEYKKAENILHFHYENGKYDKAYVVGNMQKALKAGAINKIKYFEGDNTNLINALDARRLYELEPGLYFIDVHSSFYYGMDCSGARFDPPKDKSGNPINKYLLLGKSKERIQELMDDFNQFVELGIMAVTAHCEANNIARAGKTPMPTEGMKDTNLKSEAFALIKQEAAKRSWPQTMDYCYIKSSEWFTLRNPNTGVITGRALAVISVMKTSGGKCQWEEVSIRQNYDGANYGKSYFGGNTGNIVPVDCNEANKYK